MQITELIDKIIWAIVPSVLVSLGFYAYERKRVKKEDFIKDQQAISHYLQSLRLEIEIMRDTHDSSNVLRMIEDTPVLHSFGKLKPADKETMREMSKALNNLKEVSRKEDFSRSTMVRISSNLLIAQGNILKFKL